MARELTNTPDAHPARASELAALVLLGTSLVARFVARAPKVRW